MNYNWGNCPCSKHLQISILSSKSMQKPLKLRETQSWNLTNWYLISIFGSWICWVTVQEPLISTYSSWYFTQVLWVSCSSCVHFSQFVLYSFGFWSWNLLRSCWICPANPFHVFQYDSHIGKTLRLVIRDNFPFEHVAFLISHICEVSPPTYKLVYHPMNCT